MRDNICPKCNHRLIPGETTVSPRGAFQRYECENCDFMTEAPATVGLRPEEKKEASFRPES